VIGGWRLLPDNSSSSINIYLDKLALASPFPSYEPRHNASHRRANMYTVDVSLRWPLLMHQPGGEGLGWTDYPRFRSP
jgi:hypothetical protein